MVNVIGVVLIVGNARGTFCNRTIARMYFLSAPFDFVVLRDRCGVLGTYDVTFLYSVSTVFTFIMRVGRLWGNTALKLYDSRSLRNSTASAFSYVRAFFVYSVGLSLSTFSSSG